MFRTLGAACLIALTCCTEPTAEAPEKNDETTEPTGEDASGRHVDTGTNPQKPQDDNAELPPASDGDDGEPSDTDDNPPDGQDGTDSADGEPGPDDDGELGPNDDIEQAPLGGIRLDGRGRAAVAVECWAEGEGPYTLKAYFDAEHDDWLTLDWTTDFRTTLLATGKVSGDEAKASQPFWSTLRASLDGESRVVAGGNDMFDSGWFGPIVAEDGSRELQFGHIGLSKDSAGDSFVVLEGTLRCP